MAKQPKYDTDAVRSAAESLRFGRWTVLRTLGRRGHDTLVECRCDCGVVREVLAGNLKSGGSRSCGCIQRDRKRANEDMSHLRHIWQSAIARCHNPKNPRFASYGGRGIRVCSKWRRSFKAFVADVGPRPSGDFSLGRINNDGDYKPSNCRWETRRQQQRNMRSNRVIRFRGQEKCLVEWCEELGLRPNTVSTRLCRGWSVERALTEGIR